MSTIATPREIPRRVSSSANITTPTSSTRPSLETSRSRTSSPSSKPPAISSPNLSAAGPATGPATKRNRAALREYYNLKKAPSSPRHPSTPTLEITPDTGEGSAPLLSPSLTSASDVPPSDLDSPDFDATRSVQHTLKASSLADLLRAHARVLGEIRALDAERKGLVYDNYSRLISATETIRRMRAAMVSSGSGVGDPSTAGRTLGPAVAEVYRQAMEVRDAAREVVGEAGGRSEEEIRREKTREVVRKVVAAVEEVKSLVKKGRAEEAGRAWEMPRRCLVRWRERGVGGDDVGVLLEEGDRALRKEEVDDD